jgi:hypothetical protein
MHTLLESRFQRPSAFAALALVLAAASGAAHAQVWPGVAPCNGTLQACVDGVAAGAVIEIASNTPITSGLVLGRSVTLRPAAGFRPVFASSIEGTFLSSAATLVTIEDLSVRDGTIYLSHRGTGSTRINVRRIEILNTAPSATFGIDIDSLGSGPMTVDVRENRFERRGGAAGPIRLSARTAGSGPVDGTIAFNQVRMPDDSSSAWGILVGRRFDADITARVYGNEVRGDFVLGQIGVVGDGSGGTGPGRTRADVASNVLVGRTGGGAGISVRGDNAEVTARVYNNTIVNRAIAIEYVKWPSAGTPDLRGTIVNNLIAHSSFRGVSLTDASAVTNSHNLIFDSGANVGFTPGAGTITSDPLLLSRTNPWLRAGSPAIDAGDTTFGGLAPAFAGIPQLDGDGMRRRSGSDIDIGAREFGDVSLLHRAVSGNTTAHVTALDDPSINGDPAARLFTTPNFNAGAATGGLVYSRPHGVFYASAQWRIFSQDFVAVPIGSTFNVFRPQEGPGVIGHVTTAESVSIFASFASVIDNASLNNQPEKIVLVTQNWTSGGMSIYNPQPVGVFYFQPPGGPGNWGVTNMAPAPSDMPIGVGFNLYSQDPSPNAFRVVATEANRSGQALVLAHPLLDARPCAQVHATRIFNGPQISQHFDVRYLPDLGRWAILQQNVTQMPLGSEFFVLVNPRQVHECSSPMFADGFEAPSI